MNPLTAKKAAIKENNMLTALLKAMNIPIQLHKGIEKKLDISHQPTNIQELAQPEHQRNNYETEGIHSLYYITFQSRYTWKTRDTKD